MVVLRGTLWWYFGVLMVGLRGPLGWYFGVRWSRFWWYFEVPNAKRICLFAGILAHEPRVLVVLNIVVSLVFNNRIRKMTKTWRTWGRKMSGKDLPMQLVKLESNFEEYPLGQLGKKPTGKPLSFNTKNVLEDGTVVEGEWTLIPSSEYHEPLGFDFDVYFAVAELVERDGGMPEDGVVDFSLYELREIIGLQPGGKTYSQIRRSLELWALLGIRSKRAFWQHGECKHITDFFRIWDVTFDDSKKGGGGNRALHTISFNQRYRRSEEHTSELQSRQYLVCRLLLEKTKCSTVPIPTPNLSSTLCLLIPSPICSSSLHSLQLSVRLASSLSITTPPPGPSSCCRSSHI